ncbi:Inositol 2-dehydrogenase [bacterium HR40]|nr:Inositol 2-dehydrogenase [bacterium HR40]
MLGFALFGAGRIGCMHAANIAAHPRCRLVRVFDVVPAAAAAVVERYGGRIAHSVDEALADPEVEAVLIASSTDTHVDLIARAARARKAILCEKPIDLDMARVEACWEAIKDLNPVIQIGFNRRFDPSFEKLHRELREGRLGGLRQLIITSRDPDIPSVEYMRGAGGLLRDMTIHDFDMARFLLPEEPVEVTCFASALIDPRVAELGDHDTAMVLLRTASGIQVCINNYRRAVYGYDQRIEAVCEHGVIVAGNRRATTLEYWSREATEAKEPLLHFFVERYREAYVRELDAFLAAVLDGRSPPVSFEDGRRALRLADAAYESLRSGRTVLLEEP